MRARSKRNNADAYAAASFFKMFLGHSEDGFAGVETALRLSPRDPSAHFWQFFMCHLHTHLAQWEQAIEWCSKSIAGDPTDFFPLVDLAAANAWLGHDKEAKEAAAQLQKVYPGFTVQTWAGIHWTDDPTFNAQLRASSRACGRPGCRRAKRRQIERPRSLRSCLRRPKARQRGGFAFGTRARRHAGRKLPLWVELTSSLNRPAMTAICAFASSVWDSMKFPIATGA